MTPKLIKFTELRIEDDKYVMKACLVNPDHIVSIQSPHIIGSERERELRMISLRNSPPIFVDETVEEIHARC
jgi:hypothetical protein